MLASSSTSFLLWSTKEVTFTCTPMTPYSSSSQGASSNPQKVIRAFPWDALITAWAEKLEHLSVAIEDSANGATEDGADGAAKDGADGADVGGVGARDAVSAIEDDGTRMTITLSSSAMVRASLRHGVGDLIDVDTPPRMDPLGSASPQPSSALACPLP